VQDLVHPVHRLRAGGVGGQRAGGRIHAQQAPGGMRPQQRQRLGGLRGIHDHHGVWSGRIAQISQVGLDHRQTGLGAQAGGQSGQGN
jgi:hypothetical protein